MKKICILALFLALLISCTSCQVPNTLLDKLPDGLADKLPSWLPTEDEQPEDLTPEDTPLDVQTPDNNPTDENLPEEDDAIPEGTSVKDARDAEAGTTLTVKGVVAAITYAFGKVPSGFYLVDTTGSIYVYGKDVAAAVKVGNTVTVHGTKAYWILDKEQSSAEKFGYRGCNQIENAKILDNDNGNKQFSKKGVIDSCLLDILTTPVTEDITTNIYKVTALVEKKEGTGFTNYYFYDIDGVTGAYTYTQCNGSDFSWLDPYDGKICTVYLSPINAKSEASGCFYRLLPIALEETTLQLTAKEIAEYAVKYHAFTGIYDSYAADPAQQLTESVSSTLLGFEGATLSYESSDPDVIYFDGTVLHTKNSGRVTVTATATYEGASASVTMEITVIPTATFDSIDVRRAIEAENGEQIIVEGIVGPSLVNKMGFYLIDDNGVIAVLCTSEQISTLKVGDRIVIEATRGVMTDGSAGHFGQSYLKMDALLANYFGKHEYSDASFVTNITADGFYALDADIDYSTTVFVFDATVRVEVQTYYSNIFLDGENKSITLYCSGVGQYAWLGEFDGQTVTLEVAACNWNDKGYWRGAVLAVRTEDGRVINTLNFN